MHCCGDLLKTTTIWFWRAGFTKAQKLGMDGWMEFVCLAFVGHGENVMPQERSKRPVVALLCRRGRRRRRLPLADCTWSVIRREAPPNYIHIDRAYELQQPLSRSDARNI